MPGAAVTFDRSAIARLAEGPDSPAAKALTVLALKVERQAKRLSPVDTGRLRSSITHFLVEANGQITAVVGSDVEYALYQELGTRFIEGRHFLTGALDAVVGKGHVITANDIADSGEASA